VNSCESGRGEGILFKSMTDGGGVLEGGIRSRDSEQELALEQLADILILELEWRGTSFTGGKNSTYLRTTDRRTYSRI